MSKKNKEESKPTPPELPVKEEVEKPATFEDQFHAMEGGISFGTVLDALLKSPGTVLHELAKGKSQKVAVRLLGASLLCLAVFGLIIGLFSGGTQLWAAPLKITMGLAASALITLPSLYIFGCLNGLDISLKKIAGLMLASTSLTGLLLLGLTPVMWIFSQSTHSVGFMGFLTLVCWMVAMGFGLSFLFRAAKALGGGKSSHLRIWAMIFVFVTLQMSTSMRPIVGTSEDGFLPDDKKFFLEHWSDSLTGDSRPSTRAEWD